MAENLFLNIKDKLGSFQNIVSILKKLYKLIKKIFIFKKYKRVYKNELKAQMYDIIAVKLKMKNKLRIFFYLKIVTEKIF